MATIQIHELRLGKRLVKGRAGPTGCFDLGEPVLGNLGVTSYKTSMLAICPAPGGKDHLLLGMHQKEPSLCLGDPVGERCLGGIMSWVMLYC